MLRINEQIREKIAQSIEGAQKAHDVKNEQPYARLQLIDNTLKLRIDIREWSFPVHVGKSIKGMLSSDDCNVLLHSGSSATEILITDLLKKYDAA
ncbi:hypothetical protein [Vibrio salinus]|uniref:hypothetical protein n=1 Tax=Vibrio salinus TaxID=2899784 RepID=UPI001E5AB63B|nr:hypothetical protein [Vibrio salinus]MCE0495809.1 hypothetical protein [Vibrio salinus]